MIVALLGLFSYLFFVKIMAFSSYNVGIDNDFDNLTLENELSKTKGCNK